MGWRSQDPRSRLQNLSRIRFQVFKESTGICHTAFTTNAFVPVFCLFDLQRLDPGWVKKTGSGSGMNNRELRNKFFGLKYINHLMRIRDGKNSAPVWKRFGSGINIPDPQHCFVRYQEIRVQICTDTWHSRRLVSICWRMEMLKVAVFPVPDCAWAITSIPQHRNS